MQISEFKTVSVPAIAAGALPTVIARGTNVPVRVLVENISGTLVFLANRSQDIVGPAGPTSSAYRLRPDVTQVYVLAPSQQLYAAGNGLGGLLSMSISEALPLV